MLPLSFKWTTITKFNLAYFIMNFVMDKCYFCNPKWSYNFISLFKVFNFSLTTWSKNHCSFNKTIWWITYSTFEVRLCFNWYLSSLESIPAKAKLAPQLWSVVDPPDCSTLKPVIRGIPKLGYQSIIDILTGTLVHLGGDAIRGLTHRRD